MREREVLAWEISLGILFIGHVCVRRYIVEAGKEASMLDCPSKSAS